MPTNNYMKRRAINLQNPFFSSSNHSFDYQMTNFYHDRHDNQRPLVTAGVALRRIHDHRPPAQFYLPLDIEQGNNKRMSRNGDNVGNFAIPVMSDSALSTSVSVHDPSATFVEPKRSIENDGRHGPAPGFYQFSVTKPWTGKSTGSHAVVRPSDWSPDHDRTAQHLREEFHIGPQVPLDLSIPPDPRADEKPQDLRKLLELAIFGSPQHKLTVAEIYDALSTRFSCYRSLSEDETNAWKSTIRTTLSKSAIFQKVENPGSSCSFWTLDVSNIAASGSKRKRTTRRNSVPGSSPRHGTAASHNRKSSPKMPRMSTGEKRAARYPLAIDTRFAPSNHDMDVDADHESHVRKRCRYNSARDIGENDTPLLVNHIPVHAVRLVQGIESIIKDIDIDEDPTSQTDTNMSNAYWWKETMASSLPASLASFLFKSSSPDKQLRPIITEALRVPVQLPPLRDVIWSSSSIS